MPSRYKRPAHDNGVVEFTLHDHVEKTLNWRVDYNRSTRMFILTDKRGHEMELPQGSAANIREILSGHLREHGSHT